jgi:hypothetical protein
MYVDVSQTTSGRGKFEERKGWRSRGERGALYLWDDEIHREEDITTGPPQLFSLPITACQEGSEYKAQIVAGCLYQRVIGDPKSARKTEGTTQFSRQEIADPVNERNWEA